MNTIAINNVEYFHTADLMTSDKDYFKCCKGKPRAIIEWKKIPESEYIFAYQKDNQWVVSKKEYNKAYLLLTKSFCEANLPSMKVEPEIQEPKPEPKKVVKRVLKVKDAPPVLQLADSEKFKDEEGRPLDIEVRGERSHDKIYFKVKDVAIAFEMQNLSKTIGESSSKYVYEVDYCLFNVSRNKKVKFLTYRGFQRLIEVNRQKHIPQMTKYIAQKWLNTLFDKTQLEEYNLIFYNKDKVDFGMVYIVTSGICNGVKVGFWKGTYDGLKKRYMTYYGRDLDIFYVETMNPRYLESKFFGQFEGYKISNELYDKKYVQEYQEYLQQEKVYPEPRFDCIFDNIEELIISPSVILVEDRIKYYETKKQELDAENERLKFEFQSKEYYYKMKENDLASELRETKMRAEFEKKLCEKELKIYQLENEALKAKLK